MNKQVAWLYERAQKKYDRKTIETQAFIMLRDLKDIPTDKLEAVFNHAWFNYSGVRALPNSRDVYASWKNFSDSRGISTSPSSCSICKGSGKPGLVAMVRVDNKKPRASHHCMAACSCDAGAGFLKREFGKDRMLRYDDPKIEHLVLYSEFFETKRKLLLSGEW